MAEKEKWYHQSYVQEVGFFIAMFILTMAHEWIELNTFTDFLKGLLFFLILYGQAQFHRFFVFPLFLKREYVRYALIAFIFISIGALLHYLVNSYWIYPHFYKDISVIESFIYHFVICTVNTMTILSLFLIRQYSRELQLRNQDQMLLSEMHIKYLHAQLNPHFIFNMFNNLYGVSLTDPQRVPDLILKLSNLMRYQLEKGNNTKVSLEEEIRFIENYIAMEKERIGKRCRILFRFPENTHQLKQYQIAPLILITIVENAFKHSQTVSQKWFVSIDIAFVDNSLNVNIHNSLSIDSLGKESMGVGLKNIQKRLELLYKGHYQFQSWHERTEYRTNLTIDLNCL